MRYRNHCKRRYTQKNKWAMLGLKPTLSQDSHASTAGGIKQETWRLQTIKSATVDNGDLQPRQTGRYSTKKGSL